VTIDTAALAVFIVVAMLGETWLSARHERRLRGRGAVEPSGDVYRLMALAYPGAFVAMLAEGSARGAGGDGWFAVGVGLFAVAKALKYWAIASLGERWTFRVLVPPQSARSAAGPYRWIAHPNYVAVAAELAGTAIAMHALVSGPLAVAGFAALMRRRIAIEETALTER
jgi:methyltransferase